MKTLLWLERALFIAGLIFFVHYVAGALREDADLGPHDAAYRSLANESSR